jgi:hypothetical protein
LGGLALGLDGFELDFRDMLVFGNEGTDGRVWKWLCRMGMRVGGLVEEEAEWLSKKPRMHLDGLTRKIHLSKEHLIIKDDFSATHIVCSCW